MIIACCLVGFHCPARIKFIMSDYSTVFSHGPDGRNFACRKASSINCEWLPQIGRNVHRSRDSSFSNVLQPGVYTQYSEPHSIFGLSNHTRCFQLMWIPCPHPNTATRRRLCSSLYDSGWQITIDLERCGTGSMRSHKNEIKGWFIGKEAPRGNP